ncbi:MAG: hypothetical protein WED00_03325 [Aquisalimonadaceae bacterium]
MTTDYRPIACETYAELEVAIMQGSRLRVAWYTRNGLPHVSCLLPIDLRTRRGEEFLIARVPPGRAEVEIRLDRIRRFVPL